MEKNKQTFWPVGQKDALTYLTLKDGLFSCALFEIVHLQNFMSCELIYSFFKKRFYLCWDKWEGKEKERDRIINVWLPLMHPPLGTGWQPRHVPWLGIEPATLWFAGWHSILWATLARAELIFFCSFFINELKELFLYSWNNPLFITMIIYS